MGLSGPAGTTAGTSGSSARFAAVGYQVGFSFLRTTLVWPSGVENPSRPTPMENDQTLPLSA